MSLEAATSQLLDFARLTSKRYRYRDVQVVGLGTGGLIAKAFALRSRSVRVTLLVTSGGAMERVKSAHRQGSTGPCFLGPPLEQSLPQAGLVCSFSGPHYLLFCLSGGRGPIQSARPSGSKMPRTRVARLPHRCARPGPVRWCRAASAPRFGTEVDREWAS